MNGLLAFLLSLIGMEDSEAVAPPSGGANGYVDAGYVDPGYVD